MSSNPRSSWTAVLGWAVAKGRPEASVSQRDSPVFDDFEKSPLRFSFEAMLSEYRALRDEMTARIQKQQEITSFSIAILAGFAALTQLLDGGTNPLSTLGAPGYLLPIGSLVFSAFALMTLDHEMNIAHLQNYIDLYVKPRMNAILAQTGNTDPHAWEWNRVRSNWQQHSGWKAVIPSSLAGSKYVMTMLPSLLLLLAFWLPGTGKRNAVHFSAFGLAAAAFLLTLFAASHTARLYVKMNRA